MGQNKSSNDKKISKNNDELLEALKKLPNDTKELIIKNLIQSMVNEGNQTEILRFARCCLSAEIDIEFLIQAVCLSGNAELIINLASLMKELNGKDADIKDFEQAIINTKNVANIEAFAELVPFSNKKVLYKAIDFINEDYTIHYFC